MGYAIAFLPVLVVAGISMWQMKKRTKELIKHMRDYGLEIREFDCLCRNICAENGDHCKECNHYIGSIK